MNSKLNHEFFYIGEKFAIEKLNEIKSCYKLNVTDTFKLMTE